MDIDPSVPCNFANAKLSCYIPSDFSLPVLERYGPHTATLVFGVIPPNARFRVTPHVLDTLAANAHLLPRLECVFSYSDNVADDVGDDHIIALARAFRGLKSLYLNGYKALTDKALVAILYACPDIEEIIISAGHGNEGLLTQHALRPFFIQPRVATKLARLELLHQSPDAFTDEIILPLLYDFATSARRFKFWKTAPTAWQSWMLPEPGEVDRDEVQRKIAFGPAWFRSKNTKEHLRFFESWQVRAGRGRTGTSPDPATTPAPKDTPREKTPGEKSSHPWKGSIRKRILAGLL